MSNIFTFFKVSLPFSSGDVSAAISSFLQTTTARWGRGKTSNPLHQKMGVIRTLLDRCKTLVTEEADKQKEREHIKEALTRCGYPQWTISTV